MCLKYVSQRTFRHLDFFARPTFPDLSHPSQGDRGVSYIDSCEDGGEGRRCVVFVDIAHIEYYFYNRQRPSEIRGIRFGTSFVEMCCLLNDSFLRFVTIYGRCHGNFPHC